MFTNGGSVLFVSAMLIASRQLNTQARVDRQTDRQLVDRQAEKQAGKQMHVKLKIGQTSRCS